jgi:hypothetical protein
MINFLASKRKEDNPIAQPRMVERTRAQPIFIAEMEKAMPQSMSKNPPMFPLP